MRHIFFIHSSVDGHLGCFHVLASINSAAVNIGIVCIFSNYGFLLIDAQGGIAGSYGSCIFRFLRNLNQNILHLSVLYILGLGV